MLHYITSSLKITTLLLFLNRNPPLRKSIMLLIEINSISIPSIKPSLRCYQCHVSATKCPWAPKCQSASLKNMINSINSTWKPWVSMSYQDFSRSALFAVGILSLHCYQSNRDVLIDQRFIAKLFARIHFRF